MISSFGLLRRDYPRGPRFDRLMDHYRQDIYPDMYLDSLAIDPRMQPRVEFGDRSRGGRGFEDNRRRGILLNQMPSRSGFVEDCDDPCMSHEGRRRLEGRKSFGKAMNKLHRQLLQAEEFYGNFQTEYDNDIERIKRYANDMILSKLWVMRIGEANDSAGNMEDQDDENDELADMAEKFSGMKKKTAQALDVAINSKVKDGNGPSGKRKIRIENEKRMRDKLVTANQLILDLLNWAPRTREHCKALLHELSLLKTLIDPDVEENKELYQGGGCASEESGGMDSGHNGGGRASWEK